MSNEFGKCIRQLRIDKGIKAAKVAKAVDVFPSTLCRLERSDILTTLRILNKFCKFYSDNEFEVKTAYAIDFMNRYDLCSCKYKVFVESIRIGLLIDWVDFYRLVSLQFAHTVEPKGNSLHCNKMKMLFGLNVVGDDSINLDVLSIREVIEFGLTVADEYSKRTTKMATKPVARLFNNAQSIGDCLCTLAKLNNVEISKFHEVIGVCPSTVRKLVSGATVPVIDTIQSLCNQFPMYKNDILFCSIKSILNQDKNLGSSVYFKFATAIRTGMFMGVDEFKNTYSYQCSREKFRPLNNNFKYKLCSRLGCSIDNFDGLDNMTEDAIIDRGLGIVFEYSKRMVEVTQ